MRTPTARAAFLLVGLCLTCCAGPRFASEFVAAVHDLPPGQVCRLTFLDGKIVRYFAPTALDDIPADARRTANDYVQPGGRLLYAGREWGPEGVGFRLVKEYDGRAGTRPTRRSVLVTADGTVLSRSHEIAQEESPAGALETVAREKLGAVERQEVIQRAPEEEVRYAFEIVDDQGRRWTVVCTGSGEIRERGRLVDAELGVSHSN